MTSIKCRYSIPYCSLKLDEKIYFDGYGGYCNSEETCDEYHPPISTSIIDSLCHFCAYRSGEFEKSVKSYTYEDGCLKIGRKVYYEYGIEYLEIDGRILVGEDEAEVER